jgi:hypothetical protein
MATAATGSAGKAMAYLKAMLAAGAVWRSWTGAGSAAAAATRVYIEALPLPVDRAEYTPDELERLRPFALIWPDPSQAFRAVPVGVARTIDGGTMMLTIEDGIETGLIDQFEEAITQFRNRIEGVIADLITAGAGHTAGYLVDPRIETVESPHRRGAEVEAAQGVFHQATYRVQWGMG